MSITAMKHALEAWQTSCYGSEIHHKAMLLAMTKIGQAIEQAEKQEPVAGKRLELVGHADLGINNIYIFNGYGEEVPEGRTPLYAGYTTPQPQREWVGLTDVELAEFSDMKLGSYDLCLEVEAKLRSKNT